MTSGKRLPRPCLCSCLSPLETPSPPCPSARRPSGSVLVPQHLHCSHCTAIPSHFVTPRWSLSRLSKLCLEPALTQVGVQSPRCAVLGSSWCLFPWGPLNPLSFPCPPCPLAPTPAHQGPQPSAPDSAPWPQWLPCCGPKKERVTSATPNPASSITGGPLPGGQPPSCSGQWLWGRRKRASREHGSSEVVMGGWGTWLASPM